MKRVLAVLILIAAAVFVAAPVHAEGKPIQLGPLNFIHQGGVLSFFPIASGSF